MYVVIDNVMAEFETCNCSANGFNAGKYTVAASGEIRADIETMNVMKTFVVLLKIEYGASDGNRERPCSPSSVGDANPAPSDASADLLKVSSAPVDGFPSLSGEPLFTCITSWDAVRGFKIYHENEI